MTADNRSGQYDFSAACISEGDYWLLETKQGQKNGNSSYGKYDDYTVCFFDTESCTLYYIHNNI